jgi:putative endonuclease
VNRKYKGKRGEMIAKNYLINNSYRVLESNWTCRWGEIDIIAEKEGTVYFVEVKYRTSSLKGDPWDSITFHKKRSLLRSAHFYLGSCECKAGNNLNYSVLGIFITENNHVLKLRVFRIHPY